MRRTEGRAEHDAAVQRPRKRVDGRHLYHFFLGEIWQYRGGSAREQGLACPRRTIEREVVSARCRNDEPALRTLLSANLVEGGVVVFVSPDRAVHARTLFFLCEQLPDDIIER